MNHIITHCSDNGTVKLSDDTVTLIPEKDSDDARFSVSIGFPEWEDDAYVFLPACAYNGNRFKRKSVIYPPMYGAEDCGVDGIPLIADVPALNPDGSGKIEVTSGDLSVPCCGVFFRHQQKAVFIFTSYIGF